ncbi:CPBP family intramembrane glutamic endopeptidase [Paenibacillus kobensis]|uniref:CPBP family intramembrane glutamic endopeptidase n=1 Tax=Paenibacillus kobensis TaxID=59841 RepID=UPI000FDA3B98|nr:type II CAAX endopeptidase family protein [Paenibacillus kobensis]
MDSIQNRKPGLGLIILIYYIVTSIGALLLGFAQPALGVPEVVIQLTQFGPALGVLSILLLWKGEGRSTLNLNLRFWPLSLRKLIAVAVLIIGTFATVWLWYAVTERSVAYTSPASLSHPFWLIVIAQFIGAAGEEVGWRCFLQPKLQSRIGLFPASVVVGILWGVWHIGVFAEGWVYASLFVLFTVSLSVILGELLIDARGGKLVLATSYHALINLGMLLWFNEEDGSRLAMGTLATVCAISAVIVMGIGRRKRIERGAVHGMMA